MGNSDSLADPVEFRPLISTGCPPDGHRPGSPAFILVWLPLRVTPVTPEVHLSVMVVFVRIDAAVFPNVGEGRQLHCAFRGYVWVRISCDRRFAQLPFGAFVRELNASGFPLHLPQATWVNYQIPTAGL